MYLRLLVTIPLAFYTSRVVLQQLGVSDFGIYQAIAGIITLFTTLRGAFDSATQRYYNVALAKGDSNLLSRMFSTSIIIHIVIALILIAIIEVFGLWFIANKMQYPHSQASEVYFVFHTMVLSVVFIVLAIPYTGMIIAKEHMKFYAYLSILDVLLKCGLVMLLVFIPTNKLKVYALFQLSVTLLMLLLNIGYFRRNFHLVRFVSFDKSLFKEMFSFSGWAFAGNICYSLVHEGVNLLLNVFGGVVANAARGIAFQVRGNISTVLTTTIMPARPQATQLYISGETDEFWKIIYSYSKVLFLLASLMVIPILFFSKEIIKLWLGMEPEYSVIFLQILMIYTLIRSLHEPLDIVYKASGRMKTYQLSTVCISSLTFFGGWILLKLGLPIYSPFILFCIVETVLLIVLLVLAHKDGISLKKYIFKVILPCTLYIISALLIALIIKEIRFNWIVAIILLLISLVCLIAIIGLNKSERNLILTKILKLR